MQDFELASHFCPIPYATLDGGVEKGATMASTEKLDNGKWRGIYRKADGKKETKSFARQRDAIAWARKKEADRDRILSAGYRGSFEEVGERWLREYAKPAMRPRSYEQAVSIWNRHVVGHLGEMPIDAITVADLRAWVGHLIEEEIAPSTIRRYMTVPKAIFKFAIQDGAIESSPADRVTLPSVPRREQQFLELGELKLLASQAGYYGTLIMFLGMTGLRWSEMAALRVSDFSGGFRKVHVGRTLQEVTGQGLVESTDLKTASGRRSVGIPKPLAEMLQQQLEDFGTHRYFFETIDGTPMRGQNFRKWVWLPLVDRAGFTGLRVHDLRHTAISMWIAMGADPKLVSQMAGHSKVSFTLDRYGHLWDNADEDLMDRMASGF